jgi:hypothetical protein
MIPNDIYFLIQDLKLTELPDIYSNCVVMEFSCRDNYLTSLKHSPKIVLGHLWCYGNKLMTLIGCSKISGESANFFKNNLMSLDFIPLTSSRIHAL